MMETALWWLLLNIISIIILAFFSMTEMACVSFNRVRLHYYASKGVKRALWLNTLLSQPSLLFGTTLIGDNIAMVVGSECARQFHSSLGVSPDFAPLSQVIIVVVFGELAPMFAARHYPERVAMLGAPLLYASARLMTPLLWLVDGLSRFCHWIVGGKGKEAHMYLTQDELQHILEEQDEEIPTGISTPDFNTISSNLFRLREKRARDVMIPLSKVPLLPSHATVGQLKNLLQKTKMDYIPLYHNHENNLVGIAHPRDLIRIEPGAPLKPLTRPPWFVTTSTQAIPILKQFRTNNQNVAVVLNRQGNAIGIIDIENLLGEIFSRGLPRSKLAAPKAHMIDRTLPGDLTVATFEKEHGVYLYKDKAMTLGELVTHLLERFPEEGDVCQLRSFEFTVEETSLREVKKVHVRSTR